VRLNRKAVQADAPASPEGRGPPGRGNPARPTKFRKSAFRRFFRFCAPMPDVRDENLLAGSTESQSGSG
ncbi:hypothetical protein, partial [Pantoea allii]|uniref:hypothetical protein n=2 Tax=Pantoea allii TaxID=574096 RepID=UPI001ABFD954